MGRPKLDITDEERKERHYNRVKENAKRAAEGYRRWKNLPMVLDTLDHPCVDAQYILTALRSYIATP